MFRALASPHRRRILDLLRAGPRTTGDLAGRLEGVSRYAAMQHLGVLEAAGLVVARREGRLRFNHLNAVPLRRAYERWVGRFAGEAAAGLLAVERLVEATEGTMDRKPQTVRIENEITLRATQERVFKALTTEQRSWYPHTYGGDRVLDVLCEEFVGGKMYEDWGEGLGVLYGFVKYWDPPRVVATVGYLRGATTIDSWFIVEPAPDGCVLKQSMVVFGDLSDDEVAGIRSHGDISATENQLRAYVEAP